MDTCRREGGKNVQRHDRALKPFAIRGALWYQGESAVFAQDRLKYAGKMKALIEGWRQAWGYDFPFYFVQLPPCRGYPAGELPYLWEAQVASLKIPGTGMVVTTDLAGKAKVIHPKNKAGVGNRLALLALAKDYGKKDLAYSGPLYKAMKIEGGKIRLSFAHAGGDLKSRDGRPLTEFEIAGADGKFVPAQAAIDSDTVVVQAKEVATPTQARFGCATWQIRTWSTRKACPPRRSKPTTGRAGQASERRIALRTPEPRACNHDWLFVKREPGEFLVPSSLFRPQITW